MDALTGRDSEDLVVHIVNNRAAFLDKLARFNSCMLKDIYIKALCGETCRVGGRYREMPTCVSCIALYDPEAK